MGGDVTGRSAGALRVLSAAVCVLALLAGCGGGGDAGAEVPPLEEQLALDDEGIALRQVQAENLIRDCMKAQGFDYVPVDPAAQRAALVGRSGMSKEDFEKEFGYGITTLYEQRREQAVAGPNEAIRDSLGEAERTAYDRALYGDDPTATFAEALDTGDFSRLGGCIKQATDRVFGGTEVLQTLQGKLDELDERILADPRMVKAVDKWSECMRAEGFDGLDVPEEVDEVLQRRLGSIVGSPDAEPASDTEGEPAYDRAALADLQRMEVAMVTADIACERRHISSVEEKVTAEYEADFREQNTALLDKVVQR
jgi:hypothetical protein